MEPSADITSRHSMWPLTILGVFVCFAGTLTGAFFGMLATAIYDAPDGRALGLAHFGGLIGGLLGLAAGLVWCRLMFRASLRLVSQGRAGVVMVLGLGWGTAVGSASALCVHVGLWAFLGQVRANGLLAALVFGAPAGVVVGLVCGGLCALAAWLAVRRRG
ncbi:MAG: hypothetical protein ACE15C_01480 [Phycisphaerae bacterium]